MLYVRVFLATAWDLFFLLKDSIYKGKSVDFISSDIRDHLGFFFEQQNRDVPEITAMVKELKFIAMQSGGSFDCAQREEFINKYTVLFS